MNRYFIFLLLGLMHIALCDEIELGMQFPDLEFKGFKFSTQGEVLDSTTYSLDSIIASGKPVLIYFFDVTFQ